MAKCKNCHRKGFMIETDFNGLCDVCAPYYYLTLPDDLKALTQALRTLERAGSADAAPGRLEIARSCLERLRPYVLAGLTRLPESLAQLEQYLAELAEQTTFT
jgi:hypothetical protein